MRFHLVFGIGRIDRSVGVGWYSSQCHRLVTLGFPPFGTRQPWSDAYRRAQRILERLPRISLCRKISSSLKRSSRPIMSTYRQRVASSIVPTRAQRLTLPQFLQISIRDHLSRGHPAPLIPTLRLCFSGSIKLENRGCSYEVDIKFLSPILKRFQCVKSKFANAEGPPSYIPAKMY